jgi:hypothetical protein
MKKLKKSEKSRGIVAFANNNKVTDYISIAKNSLKIAEKTLGLPTTLISLDDLNYNNTRYDIDTEQFVEWKNYDRCLAYDLSPYDETIVIDADYLILDNNLNKIFDCQWDYLLQRNNLALSTSYPTKMGTNSLPYVWATVFAFRKTKKSKLFFDLILRIQKNYNYYKLLFNIDQRNFRNDYAFAMADIILNGYSVIPHSVPGTMITVDQVIQSIIKKDNKLIIKDNSKSFVLPITNLHIMSKAYLQSENFLELVNELA